MTITSLSKFRFLLICALGLDLGSHVALAQRSSLADNGAYLRESQRQSGSDRARESEQQRSRGAYQERSGDTSGEESQEDARVYRRAPKEPSGRRAAPAPSPPLKSGPRGKPPRDATPDQRVTRDAKPGIRRERDSGKRDAGDDSGRDAARERGDRRDWRDKRPLDHGKPDKRAGHDKPASNRRDEPRKRRYLEHLRASRDHRYKSRRHRHPRGYWPWYHTFFISPIYWDFHSLGYHTHALPRGWVHIGIYGGHSYFYVSGAFFRAYDGGYIVARAPLGALIGELPYGYIAFGIGPEIYYYVNETYYLWDNEREMYFVVEKPVGADEALAAATEGRLRVYPRHGQSQEQEAMDRYECHRWAVSVSRFDPTLEDTDYDSPATQEYRHAIAACLRARGYDVE